MAVASLLGASAIGGLTYDWYIHRPVYDGPANGTAVCEDGWISYAEHHQGACSHHGGV